MIHVTKILSNSESVVGGEGRKGEVSCTGDYSSERGAILSENSPSEQHILGWCLVLVWEGGSGQLPSQGLYQSIDHSVLTISENTCFYLQHTTVPDGHCRNNSLQIGA